MNRYSPDVFVEVPRGLLLDLRLICPLESSHSCLLIPPLRLFPVCVLNCVSVLYVPIHGRYSLLAFTSLTFCVHSVRGPDSKVSPAAPMLLCIVPYLVHLDCPSHALPDVPTPLQPLVSLPGHGTFCLWVKPVRVSHCTC